MGVEVGKGAGGGRMGGRGKRALMHDGILRRKMVAVGELVAHGVYSDGVVATCSWAHNLYMRLAGGGLYRICKVRHGDSMHWGGHSRYNA